MTITRPFHKQFDVDQSAVSIALLGCTSIEPSGNGVWPLDETDVESGTDDFLLFSFFGNRTAADNETATAKITGWKRIGGLYIPLPLASLALQFGASVGKANFPVIATNYFADTITQPVAILPDSQVISPADDSIAFVKIDPFGCDLVQVQLAKGTCASVNCLVSPFGSKAT